MQSSESLPLRLAAANLAICTGSGADFSVIRPHHLSLLERQFNQRAQVTIEQRYSHLAFMLTKLKPFASCNVRTASLLLVTEFGLGHDGLLQIGGMLKHGASVDTLAEALVAQT